MRVARAINNLIEAFERLPGVGPKTAARLTYYLLHVPQADLDRFATSLSSLKKDTVECQVCHNVSQSSPCDICSDSSRDQGLVCVVEQPLDVLALENGGGFAGVYHVLHGIIDPLHNIGPDEIKVDQLVHRCRESQVREVIFALNPTMEGEATALYINKLLRGVNPSIKITRIAHGLPVGADIQYADEVTLSRALEGRREY